MKPNRLRVIVFIAACVSFTGRVHAQDEAPASVAPEAPTATTPSTDEAPSTAPTSSGTAAPATAASTSTAAAAPTYISEALTLIESRQSVPDLSNLHNDELARASSSTLSVLLPYLNADQIDLVVARLTPKQIATLRSDQRPRFLRARSALDPGVRLVGDAYAQLVEAASDVEGQASFGAGLDVEELSRERWHVHGRLVIRKGTSPSVLTDEERRGTFILNPQVEDFYAGLSFDGEAALGYFLVGGSARFAIARTDWQTTVETMDGEATGRAAAVSFAGSIGPVGRYVVSQDDNYVEIWLYGGLGFRAVSVSTPSSEAFANFSDASIRTTRTGWFALDVEAGLRINTVEVRALVAYVESPEGDGVRGLTGISFIPSIAVHTGASLVDF